MENTFDTHLSMDLKKKIKNYMIKKIKIWKFNISAGEIIEKTLKNEISLREYLINQINIDLMNLKTKNPLPLV